jgi:hypothetical protein
MKSIKNFVYRLFDSGWFYPLALLMIGIISYALMLPRLGFYWDDWESVYLNRLQIPSISFLYYAERPVSAIAYLIFFSFIKMSPGVTQIISLLLRWGGILFLYFTLNIIWPKQVWQNRWIGALLFVFPGFLVQFVSAAFIPHLTADMFFTCSLFLTLLAIKDHKHFWVWMPLSVVLGILQIFMLEYFVVLEIIRPILIWLMLMPQGDRKNRVFWKVLRYWSPFLIGLLLFCGWRFFYLPTTMVSDPNSPGLLKMLFQFPIQGLVELAKLGWKDIGYLLFGVWANPVSPELVDYSSKTVWLGWILGLVSAILFSLYIKRRHDESTTEKRNLGQRFLLGAIALFAGAFPVWATKGNIDGGAWSDRFTLAPMLGAVILAVCVIDWLLGKKVQKQWPLVLLLASSMSLQFYTGNKYRLDWENQRDLYWQLAWRIPSMKPGTAIIGRRIFSGKSSYYDATYIINLLFDKQVQASPRYAYFDIYHLTPDYYYPNIPLTFSTRSGNFFGNTSQVVGMYFDASGGCVRLLDPVYTADPDPNSNLKHLISISNLNLIVSSDTPTSPDRAIFGDEPSHGWCYYFEKADLARQMKDWHTVLQIGIEAESKGFNPVRGAEYLPFIEANAQTGNWSIAMELSQSAIQMTPTMEPVLCAVWNHFKSLLPGSDGEAIRGKAINLYCVGTAP